MSNPDSITSDVTKFAAANDGMYSFSAGTFDISQVGLSPALQERLAPTTQSQILKYCSEFAASCGKTPVVSGITKETVLGAGVAATASFAALGVLDPTAILVGATAGVISSISKGSSKNKGGNGLT